MLGFLWHGVVVPDSIQGAICEDDPLGGVAGLDGRLQFLAHRAHKVSLGPLTSKSSLLHGGEMVVSDHCCCGGAVAAGLVLVGSPTYIMRFRVI